MAYLQFILYSSLKSLIKMKSTFLVLKNLVVKYAHVIFLILFTIFVFGVTIRINVFRYNNFDFGKFDLGNMAQMAWYTLNGKFMYLTDYFGTNLPRWSMSHVDPILVLFVPIFAVFPHALTLVVLQVALVLGSCFLVYKIAKLHTNSNLASLFFALAYLFYPAIGFLNAWTGYHGVTAAIFFFFAAFYVFEKMYFSKCYSKKGIVLFWILLVITMSGKEQIPLYIIFYGLFIMFFRFITSISLPQKGTFLVWFKEFFKYKNVQIGISMILVGILWFVVAFFVIIPMYSQQRIDGYNKFAKSLDISNDTVTDVTNDNYFISRYDAFGDSYTEVIMGMVKNPTLFVQIFFGGDKIENLQQTFEPLGYTPLLYPTVFVIALPDLIINYSTSAGGIGTAEITNHRISMIIPVLIISSIFALAWLSKVFVHLVRKIFKKDINYKYIIIVLSFLLFVCSFRSSFKYENPVYLWVTQAIQKRVNVKLVFAKFDNEIINEQVEIGQVFKLTELENKDRECAQKVVDYIPKEASVTGPDYLGAHLGLRSTYAIFPALYNEADYVVVDVFAQKILRILDADINLVRDVVSHILVDPNYSFEFGCGNLFVFKRLDEPIDNTNKLLPLQERFEYEQTTDLNLFQGLHVVDYSFPKEVKLGELFDSFIAYKKVENEKTDSYLLFLTFIHKDTGEIFQFANLPSFAINQIEGWDNDKYYIEDLQISMPKFLSQGEYMIFVGMDNKIRTRSIYLGDIKVN